MNEIKHFRVSDIKIRPVGREAFGGRKSTKSAF
jgi:hypothetical protein